MISPILPPVIMKRGHHQRVERDRRLDAGDRRADVLGDGGDGRVHDRRVEGHDELPGSQRQQHHACCADLSVTCLRHRSSAAVGPDPGLVRRSASITVLLRRNDGIKSISRSSSRCGRASASCRGGRGGAAATPSSGRDHIGARFLLVLRALLRRRRRRAIVVRSTRRRLAGASSRPRSAGALAPLIGPRWAALLVHCGPPSCRSERDLHQHKNAVTQPLGQERRRRRSRVVRGDPHSAARPPGPRTAAAARGPAPRRRRRPAPVRRRRPRKPARTSDANGGDRRHGRPRRRPRSPARPRPGAVGCPRRAPDPGDTRCWRPRSRQPRRGPHRPHRPIAGWTPAIRVRRRQRAPCRGSPQLGVPVALALHRLGVEPERDVVDERAPVDLGEIDHPLTAGDKGIQGPHHVVAVDAEIEGEVVSRARRDQANGRSCSAASEATSAVPSPPAAAIASAPAAIASRTSCTMSSPGASSMGSIPRA